MKGKHIKTVNCIQLFLNTEGGKTTFINQPFLVTLLIFGGVSSHPKK